MDDEARINVLNEMFDEILSTNCDLNDANTTMSHASEIMEKEIEDLKARDENKSKQIEMLYAVLENRLGVNVQVAYSDIEIQRAEARRMDQQRLYEQVVVEDAKDKGKSIIVKTEEVLEPSSQRESQPDVEVSVAEVEVNEENALVVAQYFILVGDLKTVYYSREDNARRIEVERRRLKAKEAKKAKVVEIVDEEKDDEDDDLKDIDDFHESDDDKDDDDDDDQDGNGGAPIVRQPGADQSTSSSKQSDLQKVFSNTPKVIYLSHDVEEGELVENWTRESMLEALGMNDENLKFDIEEEIPTVPDSEYVFKFVEDADDFNDVIVENDSSDSNQDVPFHYAGQDDNFPTFAELFRTHNEDDLRRKVAEKISTDGPPKTLSEEELREKIKKWFKQPMVEERKFKRPLKFFTRHPDELLGDIPSWGYLEDMKVYAIKREYGVQCFKFLKDIRTLPWWDVEEVMKTNNL
ncbi:hypothetical protein Hanom_Chr03g00192371 [Helianthus anomalus]